MDGFIDSTFRPKGGPSSGMFLIQYCYDKVHDCVIFLYYRFSRLYGYILVYATLCSFLLGVVPGVDWIVQNNVNYFIGKSWHCFYTGYGKVDVTVQYKC